MAQYTADYNNYYFSSKPAPSGKNSGWVGKLYPYLGQDSNPHLDFPNIFICPLAILSHSSSLSENAVTTYFFNANLYNAGLNSSDIPQHLIAFGDGDFANASYSCLSLDSCVGFGKSRHRARVSHAARTRHMGGGNYAFVDGHNKWFPPKAIGPDLAVEMNPEDAPAPSGPL